MANNGIRFGDIWSTFLSSRYGAVSEPYKSSRSRPFYRWCGGTYRVLHGRNVSRVVGQRYSVCEEGRNERPLTGRIFHETLILKLQYRGSVGHLFSKPGMQDVPQDMYFGGQVGCSREHSASHLMFQGTIFEASNHEARASTSSFEARHHETMASIRVGAFGQMWPLTLLNPNIY